MYDKFGKARGRTFVSGRKKVVICGHSLVEKQFCFKIILSISFGYRPVPSSTLAGLVAELQGMFTFFQIDMNTISGYWLSILIWVPELPRICEFNVPSGGNV